MGENNANNAAGASFDGIIKQWPQDQVLIISNIPKDRTEFLLYMACELFKVQNITNPKKQAKEAINNAKCLYDALNSAGLISK